MGLVQNFVEAGVHVGRVEVRGGEGFLFCSSAIFFRSFLVYRDEVRSTRNVYWRFLICFHNARMSDRSG